MDANGGAVAGALVELLDDTGAPFLDQLASAGGAFEFVLDPDLEVDVRSRRTIEDPQAFRGRRPLAGAEHSTRSPRVNAATAELVLKLP